MKPIIFEPIGVIRTSFKQVKGMPIQPSGAEAKEGRVIVDPAFEAGLEDIDGFSHLILIYQFHLSKGYSLSVQPFLDNQHRGIFSTRAPRRPNPVGISIVSFLRREKNELVVENIDVVDGTPLIDIKPYVPEFDAPEVTTTGWLEHRAEKSGAMRSDERFK
jgi:tRNA-Thr(GGU) m(6)t(6)A37 methyltransferase TsaA